MSMDLCRPFLSSAPGEGSDFDLGGGGSGISGPTHLNRSCMMMMNMSGETYNGAAYLPGCCAGGEPVDATRKLMQQQQQQQQQPFDMSNTSTCVSLSKSPGGITSAGGSMGFFPFTNAQWKELERQAMVFKYMMHSIPVPYELLFPFITATNPSDPSGMRSDSHLLKFLRNGDPEPGRCRRTDGKKWRCSNAVALDQKYCEKHVHRGRPRSRKHVEAASDFNKSNKKPCLAQNQPTTFPAPPASKPISDTQNAACLDSDQLFRSSALQLPQTHLRNGDLSEDQWHQLRMPDLSSYSTTNPFQQHQQLRLSSYNTPPKPEFNLFLNPDLKKQPLIDAWTVSDNPTSNQNHELISLGLSMGHGYSEYGEKQPQIGSNWLSQSGGPLGEVLRPPSTHPLPATSSLTTAAEDNSCNNNNKNSAHVSSSPPSVSPTRVLQRAVSTLSDSTSYSSPALVTFPSQPRSGFQWLNQDKLLKQSST